MTDYTPSPIIANKLRKTALYEKAVDVVDGVVRVLAENPKDYTGPGTNTYVVGGEAVWIIDPGPACQKHVEAVLSAIAGRPVLGIFVTHTHLDHSPAAPLLAGATDCRTYGFGALDCDLLALTDEEVDTEFVPDQALADGHLVGEGDWQIMAVHTPGHFPNHMCYYLPHKGLLFSGDHVMGWSTTSIVPPLGNLAEYLASLDKLEALGGHLMLPSHGDKVTDVAGRIREIRDHRFKRHGQVEKCLADGITLPEAIVAEIYEGLTPCLLNAAKGCVEAHIEFAEMNESLSVPVEADTEISIPA